MATSSTEQPQSVTKSVARKRLSTRAIARDGVMVALLAASAWISIPIGPVPITLQVLIVAIFALTFPAKESRIIILAYVLLGAIGLPVFSSGKGGLGVLFGPTGGFIWGWLIAVFALSFILPRLKEKAWAPVLGAVIFLLITYLCGWAQYMPVAGVDATVSFATVVAPFIAIDIVKLALAVSVSSVVKKIAFSASERKSS